MIDYILNQSCIIWIVAIILGLVLAAIIIFPAKNIKQVIVGFFTVLVAMTFGIMIEKLRQKRSE